ncbi:MAG: serine/threonine-protein phosphatase [Planctomycetes bacterium]|nr:serine/threonine-protein phosphatase [Planctomycetota bacterium]
MWQIDVCGMTDIGRKRTRNEDQFLVATLTKTLDVSYSSLEVGDDARIFGNSQGRLLLVADGMGGHAAGDRASEMVVNAFVDYVLNMLRWYFRADPTYEADFTADLRDAVIRCQKRIREEVLEQPENKGMGATLTLAYVIWPRMFVVHVGDSRCYLMRGDELKQLTRDHTVGQLINEIATTIVEQAAEVPDRKWHHVLWNAVGGGSEELQPDIFRVDLEFGDRLLICTDGLTNQVTDAKIALRLQQEQSATETCCHLIEDANENGGSDNITVIVARIPTPEATRQELADAAAKVTTQSQMADTAEYEVLQPAHGM